MDHRPQSPQRRASTLAALLAVLASIPLAACTGPADPAAPQGGLGVAAVSPASGPSTGGTILTIDGAGFTAGASVRLGGVAAREVVVEGATRLTALAPAHAGGPVDLEVRDAAGQVATRASAYTYVDPPALSSVDPGHVPEAGGTVVLHGQGFGAGAQVRFGAEAAAGEVQRLSAEQLVAVAPPQAPGVVDVAVVNPDGQQAVLFAALAYDAAPPPPPAGNPPLLASVTPAAGSEGGGTVLTLAGSDFDPAAQVTIGGAPATVTSHAASSLTVTTPPHAPGVVDVLVRNPDGRSSTLAAAFTYVAVPPPPPVLSALTPTSGPEAGGTTVLLSGGGFRPGATVTLGAAPAVVLDLTPDAVTVLTGSHPAATVDVELTNPDGQRASLPGAFTFVAAPVLALHAVSPASGPTAGGTRITLAGSAFAAGAAVTVGGLAATGVTVSATSITATTPAHAAGVVPVSVRNPDGAAASLAAAFAYLAPPAPVPTAAAPTSGPDLGGTAVTISGSGFEAGATVAFNGTPAAVVQVTATTIAVTAPPHAPGAVDLVVSNPDGQQGTLLAGFTYLPPPQLSGVAPASGPAAGGTSVTLAGSGLQAGAAVRFGGAPAAVTGGGSSGLVVTSPAHAAGPVDVAVTNPDGRVAALAAAFTYLAPPPPPPTLSSVAPTSGSTLGGRPVTLSGAGFDGAAAVTFGGAQAVVTARSATSLSVATPAHAAGPVDVVVVNGDGQSASLAGGFAYLLPPPPPPSLLAVAPASGPAAGGTQATISGANFAGGATVSVGGAAAAVSAVTVTAISITTPAHAAGPVDVTVTNPDGQASTLAGAFTYLAPPPPPPALAGLSPAEGPDAGGTLVTLAGSAFSAGLSVDFGGAPALVGAVTATSVQVQAPAHLAGTVDVTVTNPDGQASTLPAAYAYLAPPPPPPVLPAPVLASVLPPSGPTAGGSAVALLGASFQPGATVSLGGLAATVGAVAGGVIDLTTPAHAAGAVDVTVTNPDGQRVTLPAAFTYLAPPTLVALSPSTGPTTGGTSVVLTGAGFGAGATVSFGGAAAAVGAVTATSVTVTTPAHAAGAVAVSVTNPDGQSSTQAAGFTYVLPPPAVTSLAPASGTTLGGTSVTVTGAGFQAGASATLGGSPAVVGALTASSLTLTTPAHAAGPVALAVTNPDGQAATLPAAFTYVAPPLPPPTLSGLAPASGPDAGGTAVTLAGSNFQAGATVTFGGASAAVGAVSATAITAVSPGHLVGLVDVTVTNPDGQSSTLGAAFTFVAPPPPPILSAVLPATGTTAGGTAVSLAGAGFQPGAAVSFGGLAAGVVSSSATAIAVTTPAHAAGPVGVTVTNPDGQSVTLPGAFSYVAPPPPPPVISGLTPVSGTTAGGTSVTLAGAAFSASPGVTLGGLAATVTASSATSITATTPPHPAGPVDVVVTNADGQRATLAAAFGYLSPPPPPVLGGVSPASGSTAGGTHVVLSGSGFAAGAAVAFGASPAAVQSVTATSLTVASPAHAAGAVDVTVINPDGQASTLAGAFLFVAPPPAPTVASATPGSGSTAGGTSVVLAGTGFLPGATVTLGGAAAAVGGLTATAISITTPPHAAGAVDLVVANPDGQQVTLSGGFTFVAPPAPPVLASVAPSSGDVAGGTPVVLGGTGFASGAAVTFGGLAGVVTASTATSLSVTTPAGVAGAVDVVVTNPDGRSSALAGAFTYTTAPTGTPPLISGVTPASGFDVGGTTVTITGSEFVNPVVSFGGAAVAPSASTKTSITVTTPAHAAGAVDVVVTNQDGQSAIRVGAFTYLVTPVVPPPVVTSVSPASGPTTGNTVVTLTGTGFAAGSTVAFGGVAGVSVAVLSSTSISVTTPGGPAGPVDVTVVNFDRQSATLAGGYTYVAPPPVVTAINVRGSPQAGGGLLVFAGTGLSDTVSVTFGGALATDLTYDPVRGTLTVTIPPSPLGPTADGFVDLVLTNLDGQSTTRPNFHYGNPPQALAFTPTTGSKGDTMVIDGVDFTADATGPRAGLQVSFGGTFATISQKSPTGITLTVPKLNPGTYTILVVNFDSQFSIAPGTFFVPGP